MLLHEMERSARKAASERSRENRQAVAVRGRALEREMIREERASERARIQAEKERDMAIAEAKKRSVQLTKREAKQAQLREWRLEAENHNQRDEDLLHIGNEAPEVEDRDQLYQELMEARPYDAPDFVAPHLSTDQLERIRKAQLPKFDSALAAFHVPAGGADAVQLGFSIITIAAAALAMLPHAPPDVSWVPVGGVSVWLVLEATRRASRARLWTTHSANATAEYELAVGRSTDSLRVQVEDQARAAFEAHVAAERAGHEAEQYRRHAHLRSLQAGALDAMQKELADMFPLEGPFQWEVRTSLKSASAVTVDVMVPLGAAMQTRAATVLASGKVSYKKKTQKRFREECQRVLAGTAIRYASEVMLLLPTLNEVVVRCLLSKMDAATGRGAEVSLLEVKYDYGKLAPLQMADIDPHAALEHFPHSENIKDVAAALLAGASE